MTRSEREHDIDGVRRAAKERGIDYPVEAPGASHEDGNGMLADGRMYQPARVHDAVRDRTLEITFLEPGAEAYSFTFG